MNFNLKVTPEGNIKSQIRQYLSMRGWKVINIMQGPLCERGISDLICIRKGQVIFLEVKTSKGNQSMHQKQFQDDIEAHEGKYLLIRSLDELLSLGY